MKDIGNSVPLEVETDLAKPTNRKRFLNIWSKKRTFFLRWLLTFCTCVFVPMCQSMPSHVTINQIEHQNIQTVNVSYNIQVQNK